MTAGLLPYAAIGLVALAANVVLTRCCFACRETLWPVTISVVTVIVNVLLSLVWLPTLGRARALAGELAQSKHAGDALARRHRASGLRHRLGRAPGSAGKVALSSIAMLAALGWIGALGVTPEATLASRAWFLFGQIAIGGTVFVAVARMLGVEELDLAWRTIVAKFERNLVSPPENREAPIA